MRCLAPWELNDCTCENKIKLFSHSFLLPSPQTEHLIEMVTLPFEWFTDNVQHHANRPMEVKTLSMRAERLDGTIIFLQQMYLFIGGELSVVRVLNLYLFIYILFLFS